MDYFVIEEKLPSLNDVIDKNRTNRYAGAKYKKDIEEKISYYIYDAVSKGTLHKQEKPCIVYVDFYEHNKKRDVDNIISGGTKFILDALVQSKIILNDNRKYVKQVRCNVYDDAKDYVVVKLTEYSESDIDNKS